MVPLQQLFALEVEFFRRLRCQAPGATDLGAVHTSYALQTGYERLLRSVGSVTGHDIDRVTNQFSVAGDIRDVLAARDSLSRLLGVSAQ